jgi:hypothetical protein
MPEKPLSWKPTLKQEYFLGLPLTIKEALYGGAAGPGKSEVLLLYPIIHRWHEHPKFKGVFFRRTMPELKTEIIPRSKEFFDLLGAKFNQTDSVWTFPSGGLYFFAHVEHEKDVHKYDTTQISYAAFDELTSFLEYQYLYITFERVRSAAPCQIHLPNPCNCISPDILPAICRSGSNPGNIGHSWVKKRFIDPSPTGMEIIRGKGGNKRFFIPANVDDNIHVDPSYKQSLDALPEAERRAKKFGDWSAYEGQVFSEFRDIKYPDEPDNAIHICKPFDIPSFWPRIASCDWGYAPPAGTYVPFAAISPTERIYIYRELFWQETKIETWGAELKPYLEKDKVESCVICHSANFHRGEPHTILEQVEVATGFSFRLGSRGRVAGKMLLHEYLRWREKKIPDSELPIYDDERARWLLRNEGLDSYKKYLSIFEPIPEEKNIPKIQIFWDEETKEGCPLLINAIKSCVYDKTNKEDVAEFPGDDPYDAIRDLLHSVDAFFEESGARFKKVQEQQKVLDQLRDSNDQTSFYRNMRRIESENVVKPITRRFSGRSWHHR